jgi:hypothetical protein
MGGFRRRQADRERRKKGLGYLAFLLLADRAEHLLVEAARGWVEGRAGVTREDG